MDLLSPLLLSLKVASCAIIINILVAIPLGYFISRSRFRGKELVDTVLTLPMVLPPTVLGYYLLVLLGRRGAIGQMLEEVNINLIFTWQAAVIAASIATFPLVYKPARAAFETIDKNLEYTSLLLGVSKLSTFFRVTLPLAWRGIVAGILLGFARALGEFGATIMVAGSIPGKTRTLSTAVYEAVQAGRDDEANIYVLVISVICITLLLLISQFGIKKYIEVDCS